MDFIEQQGKLFVGTNKSQILTIDIAPLLELNTWYDQSPSIQSSTKKGGLLGMDETGDRFNKLH